MSGKNTSLNSLDAAAMDIVSSVALNWLVSYVCGSRSDWEDLLGSSKKLDRSRLRTLAFSVRIDCSSDPTS
jgi:hypothetical protein